jgi:hypothetical protein
MIKKIFFLVFLFAALFTNAQDASQPQMADSMRAEGKIYVVITVMGVIFGCVAAYLFRIDKKLKKLEDDLKNKK